MEESLKEKLIKLKKFRQNISIENVNVFDELFNSIKDDLPEHLKAKLELLKIYEYYEETDDDFDLPF